ncbi:DUF2911 domain-containing protein [Pseudopedobacter beijingensis]|uniref:DUF2911 domain-containing protein n=1 Tax=Pseudopedobacter beijingensis TaxID=1207056 RepID=A0ABW4I9D9_9SPHI
MKRTFLVFALITSVVLSYAQNKPVLSPPATAKQTLANGVEVTINYAQPSVKGRTIGNDIAPYGKVWRTGANAATQFEVNKDVTVNGHALKAGKYSLFTIPGVKEWVVIFNKTWDQWGAYKYQEKEDALRVNVKSGKTKQFTEQMTFEIDKAGQVDLLWGDVAVGFKVK